MLCNFEDVVNCFLPQFHNLVLVHSVVHQNFADINTLPLQVAILRMQLSVKCDGGPASNF